MPFTAQNFLNLDADSNTIQDYMCGLSAMWIFSTFYLKKILFGTFFRSKIFQIVFEIERISWTENSWKCPGLATFKPNLEYFHKFFFQVICYISKTIRNILDLKKVPKSFFFQMKCWKYSHGRKAAHIVLN